MSLPLTRSQLRRWQLAVFAIFLSGGLSIATWASRVPAIKLALDIDNTRVGLMLLGAGIASIIGLSLSSVVLARFGARRGMLGGLLLIACGVVLVGVAADLVHSYPLVIVGLALFGIGMGAVDVMMNVEGAAIEVQVRRTLLPLFHAFFSVGTVIGAALGGRGPVDADGDRALGSGGLHVHHLADLRPGRREDATGARLVRGKLPDRRLHRGGRFEELHGQWVEGHDGPPDGSLVVPDY